MSSHIVTSYNVLSSAFTEEPERSLRYKRLKRSLLEMCDNDHIICLQELTHEWYVKLLTDIPASYRIVIASTAPYWMGFMGCAILYPSHYQVNKIHIIRIGSELPIPVKVYDWKVKQPPPGDDPGNYASSRYNSSIVIEFDDFVVSCYHVPSSYWDKKLHQVITLHAVQYIASSQKVADNKPLICSGDFNMIPYSVGYNIITGATVDTEDNYYPSIEWNDGGEEKWLNVSRMISSYAPDHPITCRARDKDTGEVRAMSLDYIFHRGINVLDRGEVVVVNDETVYPDKNNPSDHVPISILFELQ